MINRSYNNEGRRFQVEVRLDLGLSWLLSFSFLLCRFSASFNRRSVSTLTVFWLIVGRQSGRSAAWSSPVVRLSKWRYNPMMMMMTTCSHQLGHWRLIAMYLTNFESTICPMLNIGIHPIFFYIFGFYKVILRLCFRLSSFLL